MTLTFSFHPLRFSLPFPPSIPSYHFASVEVALGRENEFSLGNGLLCGTDAKVRPLTRLVYLMPVAEWSDELSYSISWKRGICARNSSSVPFETDSNCLGFTCRLFRQWQVSHMDIWEVLARNVRNYIYILLIQFYEKYSWQWVMLWEFFIFNNECHDVTFIRTSQCSIL